MTKKDTIITMSRQNFYDKSSITKYERCTIIINRAREIINGSDILLEPGSYAKNLLAVDIAEMEYDQGLIRIVINRPNHDVIL